METRLGGAALGRLRLPRALPVMFVWLATLGVAGAAAAEGEVAVPKADAPAVALDDLLRLPSGFDSRPGGRYGGAGEGEWRSRFEKMEAEVEEVREKLARARAEYDATASDSEQWQVAPPGANNPQTSPLSFRLREEMRKLREELELVEKKQRDLEIEANLAGVPEDWRGR